jgi:hypothetical protein
MFSGTPVSISERFCCIPNICRMVLELWLVYHQKIVTCNEVFSPEKLRTCICFISLFFDMLFGSAFVNICCMRLKVWDDTDTR